MDVLPLFTWLDGSFLAEISKAYGGVFAVVQMFHLLALALLGGVVVVADFRLLGLLLTDIPMSRVLEGTHRVFDLALAVLVVSGVFMGSAVAMKLYYNEMYWAKMAAFCVGVTFVYAIRRPLMRRIPAELLDAGTRRLVAVASLATWFTVAACGRWIGFS